MPVFKPERRIEWTPWMLVSSGVFLLALVILELFRMVREPATYPLISWANILTSLPFILGLIIGGYRLQQSDISTERYSQIALWASIGAIFFGGFFAITSLSVTGFWTKVHVIRWGVAVGGCGGFLIAFVNARSTERELVAQRERIRAEETEKRREILEYLNALLRHEVLNTSNIIQGYAERLSETEGEQEYAEIIRRQAEELSQITEDVRLFLEATEEESEFEKVNLTRIVREELQKLSGRHETVETSVDMPEGVEVYADVLIHRLFSNLFENAVIHNESTTPEVSVTGTVSEETITIRVADNGSGIPEEKRDTLFEPVSGTNTTHGLGLVIVDRLAKRYGGRVELTETGTEGSVFTVELPCAPPETEP